MSYWESDPSNKGRPAFWSLLRYLDAADYDSDGDGRDDVFEWENRAAAHGGLGWCAHDAEDDGVTVESVSAYDMSLHGLTIEDVWANTNGTWTTSQRIAMHFDPKATGSEKGVPGGSGEMVSFKLVAPPQLDENARVATTFVFTGIEDATGTRADHRELRYILDPGKTKTVNFFVWNHAVYKAKADNRGEISILNQPEKLSLYVHSWIWPQLKMNHMAGGAGEPSYESTMEEFDGVKVYSWYDRILAANPSRLECHPPLAQNVNDVDFAFCASHDELDVRVVVNPSRYLACDNRIFFNVSYMKDGHRVSAPTHAETLAWLVKELQCGCNIELAWGNYVQVTETNSVSLKTPCNCLEAGATYEVVAPELEMGGTSNFAPHVYQTSTNTVSVANYDAELMDGKLFMEAEYRRIGNLRDMDTDELTCVTQRIARVKHNGQYLWPVEDDSPFTFEWNGVAEESHSRIEGLVYAENTFGPNPISIYLQPMSQGKRVTPAYVDWVVRIKNDEGTVITEASHRIYIMQIVQLRWSHDAIRVFNYLGTNPTGNPNLIGLANVKGPYLTRAQEMIEKGVQDYYTETQLGFAINILIISESTPACDDYKKLLFTIDPKTNPKKFKQGDYLITGRSLFQIHDLGGPHVWGNPQVFVNNILLHMYGNFSAHMVNNTPQNERNKEFYYAVSRHAAHEIGHELGLVSDYFNSESVESHYWFTETNPASFPGGPLDPFIPTSYLMNDGKKMGFDSMFGRRKIHQWTFFDELYLRSRYPSSSTHEPHSQQQGTTP